MNTCRWPNTFVAMSHGHPDFEHPSHLFEAVMRHNGRTVGRNTTVYDVVKGDTTKPDETKCPKMPNTPPLITGEMSNVDAEKAARYWTQFNVQMNYYNTQIADFNCKQSTWTDGNSQAMGIFNRALDIGIWDQVKDMTAAATWTWLGDHYTKSSITELLEHFRYIKDYRFNLSDPSPQLAQWMHHYQSIPTHMISASLASIILISNLPTTNSVRQESIYQRLVETMFKDETFYCIYSTISVILGFVKISYKAKDCLHKAPCASLKDSPWSLKDGHVSERKCIGNVTGL